MANDLQFSMRDMLGCIDSLFHVGVAPVRNTVTCPCNIMMVNSNYYLSCPSNLESSFTKPVNHNPKPLQ